ncbi:hypothetical protein [Streptomyces sp. NBC_00878]|uniref:hypothetical protein n=1 Tax=Streptomyces sp. NBC_00878 TaxID=2975854 RepID=UPI00224C9D88|nr:hypothetical protein [Streptomyces sp. NBC_00878]MCX4905427.1 hypothetical protein [Streptomyces sp. NBC_00878]
MADSRRPRPRVTRLRVALLRAALLTLIGLCALIHGPSEETDRPAPAVTTVSAPVASAAVPHGPHRHHEGEECGLDGAVRTTAAQAVQHPPADAGALALVGASAVLVPVRPFARRRPYRFGGRRTGRTELVRTCRWRI